MAKAIVGLGNPGPEYERTRHNAGFLLADRLAERWGLGSYRRATDAVATAGTLGSVPVRVLKPTTFMNASGDALRALRSPEFDPAADLLVPVDDVAFDPGVLPAQGAGSAEGTTDSRASSPRCAGRTMPDCASGIGAQAAGVR